VTREYAFVPMHDILDYSPILHAEKGTGSNKKEAHRDCVKQSLSAYDSTLDVSIGRLCQRYCSLTSCIFRKFWQLLAL
jgi:hypothetical protein